MNRREFPRKVRFEIIKRASDEKGNISCEGCGQRLGSKRFEIDHTIPDGLVIDKSAPLTAAEGKLLGLICCHAPKTVKDKGIIAKAARSERKIRFGDRKRSTFPCSRDSKWKKPFNGPAVLR